MDTDVYSFLLILFLILFHLPELRLGTIPGAGGTQRLPRLVGKSVAMEMILAGRSLSAKEALNCGVISKVLPDNADLVEKMLELAEKIVACKSRKLLENLENFTL